MLPQSFLADTTAPDGRAIVTEFHRVNELIVGQCYLMLSGRVTSLSAHYSAVEPLRDIDYVAVAVASPSPLQVDMAVVKPFCYADDGVYKQAVWAGDGWRFNVITGLFSPLVDGCR